MSRRARLAAVAAFGLLALATIVVDGCRAPGARGSVVEGLELGRGESVGGLASQGDRLLVGIDYRTPAQDVPRLGDGKEYSSVRVLGATGVPETARKRGVPRRIVPVKEGFALLRVVSEAEARPRYKLSLATELSLVDGKGVERVVYSGPEDWTGMLEGSQGEWVLFGVRRALVASDAARERWVPLQLSGLEPGESIRAIASRGADEYLVVTDYRLLRHSRSAGALLSAEILGRYPYPLQAFFDGRLWIVREEEGRRELMRVESDGRVRGIETFEGGGSVRQVISTPKGGLVIVGRGLPNPHSRRLFEIALGRGTVREARVEVPEDSSHIALWRDGVAVATPGEVFWFGGVGAK